MQPEIELTEKVAIPIPAESETGAKLRRHRPVTLSWKNVSFTIPLPPVKKQTAAPNKVNGTSDDLTAARERALLQDVSGLAEPGKIVAIMGASGAGKTTLLNVLAGRIQKKVGKLSGEILVNGKPRSASTWRQLVAYVEQDDLMYENLTVKETLQFAARLRLPSSMPWSVKQERVQKIINELGLRKCENSRVGGAAERGISGGERKRLSIGMELVTDPRLLFLDEPTSGLDAFTASSIIETIKKIATQEQCTILMTIHQPREYILTLFDELILLSEGKLVYTGSVQGAVKHFADCGLPCTPNTNPSDFFLDTMTIDFRSPQLRQESLVRVKKLQAAWSERAVPVDVKTDAPVGFSMTSQQTEEEKKKANNNIFQEVGILLHRNFLDMLRDKATIGATIGQAIINTIIIGFVFWRMQLDFAGIQNRVGSLFFIAINLTFGNVMPTIALFTLQLQIIRRERSAGTYRGISAFVAKLLSQIPLVVFATVLFSAPVYWMIGLQPFADKFFIFLFVTVLHAVCATILGITISSGVPNVRVGQILGPTIVVVFLVFGGQAVNIDSIPAVLQWIKYLSIIRYSYAALAVNELDGLTFPCSPSSPPTCTSITGQSILTDFSLNEFASLWYNEIAIAGWIAAYTVIGYVLFQWRSKPLMRLK